MNLRITQRSKGGLSASAQALLAAWYQLGCPSDIGSTAVLDLAACTMEQKNATIIELKFADLIRQENGAWKLTEIGRKKVAAILPAKKRASKYNVREFSEAFVDHLNKVKKEKLGPRYGRTKEDEDIRAMVAILLTMTCPFGDTWEIKHFTNAIDYKAMMIEREERDFNNGRKVKGRDKKLHDWKYLRPETLLAKKNFMKYQRDIKENWS